MHSEPPDSSEPTFSDSPVDRALSLLLAGEHEPALRWAAALVRSEPAGPIGLLLTGRLMSELGQREAAVAGLELATERALESGNLPLAVAGCWYLRELDADATGQLDEIARTFARGSKQLLDQDAKPPEMPGVAQEFRPLASALCGEALLEEVKELLKEARNQHETDRPKRGKRPKVAPQSLFSSLKFEGLRAMIEIFEVISVPSQEMLVEEGTPGAEAYVLARGELEVLRSASEEGGSDVLLARLGVGALFGEMALLSRAPRAASVVAARPSIVLVARKEALDSVVADQPELGGEVAAHCQRRMVENLVRTSPILSAVKPSERPSLMERFVPRPFEEGELLITQDQESDGLYLIASGEVEVLHREGEDTTLIARLGVGEVVGEVALVLRRPATADVIAAMPTVTLHLLRDRFLDLIKAHPSILAQLYELAVKREEETSSIVGQEAMDADELVLI